MHRRDVRGGGELSDPRSGIRGSGECGECGERGETRRTRKKLPISC